MSGPIEVTNLMANPKPVNVSAWRDGSGKDVSVSMSDDDYTAMTAAGVEWFAGDTYPAQQRGGYPPSRHRAYAHLDCEVCA